MIYVVRCEQEDGLIEWRGFYKGRLCFVGLYDPKTKMGTTFLAPTSPLLARSRIAPETARRAG